MSRVAWVTAGRAGAARGPSTVQLIYRDSNLWKRAGAGGLDQGGRALFDRDSDTHPFTPADTTGGRAEEGGARVLSCVWRAGRAGTSSSLLLSSLQLSDT